MYQVKGEKMSKENLVSDILSGEEFVEKEVLSLQLNNDNLSNDQSSFYERGDVSYKVIEDYKPIPMTNVVFIPKPVYYAMPNVFKYEITSMNNATVDYAVNQFEVYNNRDIDQLSKFVEARLDKLVMFFRRIFLAGNGHFKTKSMHTDFNALKSTLNLVLANDYKIDNDVSHYKYNDVEADTNVQNMMLTLMFMMLSQTSLISMKTPIKKIMNRSDYGSVNSTLTKHIRRKRLYRIFDNIKWPRINDGEFNIVNAAQAFQDVIRQFVTDFKHIIMYEKAYYDLIPIIKLAILNRTESLSVDYQNILDNPQFKTICSIANIQVDALTQSYTRTIQPAYTLASAIDIVYEGFMNNKDVKLLTELEVKRLFKIDRVLSPMSQKIRLVIIRGSYDDRIAINNYSIHESGDLILLNNFDELDDLTKSSLDAIISRLSINNDLITNTAKKYVSESTTKALITMDTNDYILKILAMAYSDRIIVGGDINNTIVRYGITLSDQQVNEDLSLIGFGNEFSFSDIGQLLYYSCVSNSNGESIEPLDNIVVDTKHFYIKDEVSGFLKPFAFKRNELSVKIPHPRTEGAYYKASLNLSLGDVLLSSEFLSGIYQFVTTKTADLANDVIKLDRFKKVIRKIITDDNSDVAKLYVKRLLSRYYHNMLVDIQKGVQGNAAFNYVWNNITINLNAALKSGDKALKEYGNIVGSRVEYDLKLKLSVKYATGLWILKTFNLISEADEHEISLMLLWYLQTDADVDFSPVN